MSYTMTRDMKTNLQLFIVVIILSLIAWFQPGLQQTVVNYLSNLQAEDINTIIIERQGLGQIKLKKQQGNWLLQEPYNLPANPLRVNTITALARKRSYSKFPVKDNELSHYQLDKPMVSIWLNENKFVLGSADPINQQRYVMNIADNLRSGINTVHLINGTVFYQLRANLDTFISPHLLPPDTTIQQLLWNDQSLEQSNGKWQLTTDKTDISSDSVAQLLQFWKQAQSTRIETEVSLNLDNSELVKSKSIRITLNDSESKTQTIDYLVIQEGEQIKLFRSDLKIAYWISAQTLKQLTEFLPIAESQ